MAGQLHIYLDEVDHLDLFQTSFGPVYGTETASVTLVDDLHWEMDC